MFTKRKSVRYVLNLITDDTLSKKYTDFNNINPYYIDDENAKTKSIKIVIDDNTMKVK